MQCAALPAAAITMPRRVEVGSDTDVTPVEDGKDGLYSAYSEQFSVDRSRSNFGRHPPVQYDSKKYVFGGGTYPAFFPNPVTLNVCVCVCARARERVR
jgi:hypothetical protein